MADYKCLVCSKDFHGSAPPDVPHQTVCPDCGGELTPANRRADNGKPEYFEFRCCMCPNVSTPLSDICPGIPGTPHPEPSPCRFVKSYVDETGCVYMVRRQAGWPPSKYAVMSKHESSRRWEHVQPPRVSYTSPFVLYDFFDESQAALNALAKEKGWAEWQT